MNVHRFPKASPQDRAKQALGQLIEAMDEMATGEAQGWDVNLQGGIAGPEWCQGIKVQTRLINFTNFKQFGTGGLASAEYNVEAVADLLIL